MTIFVTLIINMIPLYILIALGYAAGKWLHIDKNSLARLVLFIFMPIMVFGFVTDMELKPVYAALPLIILLVQVIIAATALFIGQKIFKDNRANLLAMSASMGNVGFFGLPLVTLLFDDKWVALYIFMMIGFVIFEATMGYYLAARGNFSVRESLIKLSKFPSLYAVVLAVIVNYMNINLSESFYTYWGYFKGCYIISGMMIIGIALAHMDKFVFGARFVSITFIGKFVAFPLLVGAFIMLDKALLNWFEPTVYDLLIVMSIVPPAAGVVAFATQMNLRPEKAATTILLGTLFALFYIPLVLMLLGIR